MSQSDREKWDARYAKKDAVSEPVDPFLEEIADRLPLSGRALDIAGGSGGMRSSWPAAGLRRAWWTSRSEDSNWLEP